MTAAPLFVVCGFAATAVLASWLYFRRYQIARPPIGVVNLTDMAIVMAGIILVPYLYLAVPRWSMAGLVIVGVVSVLYFTWEPALRRRALVWLVTLLVITADVAALLRFGPNSREFLMANDLALMMVIAGVANLWAQGGLKARDAAVLAAALTVYDLVATGLLPLTVRLLDQVTGLPFQPVVAWPLQDRGTWFGIGMGDLLLASLFPLVTRKAFGRRAGLVALAIGLAVITSLLTLFATYRSTQVFPVMVVLGPLIVLQYAFWRRRSGRERTTWQYLQAEPLGTSLAGDVAQGVSGRVRPRS